HAPQIGAALEEMSRKRMSQRVRRHAGAQPRAAGAALEDAPEALAREGPTTAVHEEDARVEAAGGDAPAAVQIAAHPVQRLGAHRHEALTTPLPRADHVAGGQVEVLHTHGEGV